MAKNRKQKKRTPPTRRKPKPTLAQSPERLQRRVTRVRPIAWSGELAADVAVFDDPTLATLPPELATEVGWVREALQLVSDSMGDQANQRLETISRRSPLSEWRLLVRGLVHWYDQRWDDALENWKRLDPQRRPSRIAKALTMSRNSNLGQQIEAAKKQAAQSTTLVSRNPATTPTTSLAPPQSEPQDSELLAAAQLVHNLRVARPSIEEAARELLRNEQISKNKAKSTFLTQQRLQWILDFCAQYRQLEPNLVAAIEQAALDRAIKQPYVDVQKLASSKIAGPPHDPDHLLYRYKFLVQFRDTQDQAEAYRVRYLTQSLPNNSAISPKLRDAIASQVHLEEARYEAKPQGVNTIFGRLLSQPIDTAAVIKHYTLAAQAYPANAKAHQEFVDWIRHYTDNERLPKSERESFEALLEPAMIRWAEGVPDEIEPRLWLVDHFLENEQLDAAKPHVQWLVSSRHADPRVRATPWKLELLEAMRLCRRKSWLNQVSEKLDRVDELWPAWLSRDWAPYLRAALLLRQNKTREYNAARQRIRDQGPTHQDSANQGSANQSPVGELTDAVMMLAAAQHMRVPAAELKPLRVPIDTAVKSPSSIDSVDLLQMGSFYWDLYRTNLKYPSYRMHGGKFANELFDRILIRENLQAFDASHPTQLRAALFWLGQRRGFLDGYKLRMPIAVTSQCGPVIRAVIVVQSLLQGNNFVRASLTRQRDEIRLLQESAKAQSDAYYRYWYHWLAEQAIEAGTQSFDSINFFGAANPFYDDDEFDDDDYDDDGEYDDNDEGNLSYDPNCDCPNCTRARAQAGLPPEPQPNRAADDLVPTSPTREPEDGRPQEPISRDGWLDFNPPPSETRRIDPPIDPNFRRTRPKDPMNKKHKKGRR